MRLARATDSTGTDGGTDDVRVTTADGVSGTFAHHPERPPSPPLGAFIGCPIQGQEGECR
ncbi:hypothetical protein GCM10010309_56040 [Streptomyces violaceochromogenes]|nr:hypothetical protein GCM10010309_56040 [Streptomyces violaceochromogenes]